MLRPVKNITMLKAEAKVEMDKVIKSVGQVRFPLPQASRLWVILSLLVCYSTTSGTLAGAR